MGRLVNEVVLEKDTLGCGVIENMDANGFKYRSRDTKLSLMMVNQDLIY